jgi:HEAT repeat protein
MALQDRSLLRPSLYLKSDDRIDRCNVVRSLAKCGDQSAITSLVAMLPQEDSDMQSEIIEALEQIGTRLDMFLIVRKQIVDTLVKDLLARFRSDDEAERMGALQKLGEIGHERSIFPLVIQSDDESSIHEWFSDDESRRIDTQAVENLLDELIASLHSEKGAVRLGAVQALGKFGDLRAAEPLAAIFVQYESAMQCEIINALGGLGALRRPKQPAVAALVEPLLARLNTDDQTECARIVQMLGQIGDRRAVPALLAIFAQQDSAIQVKIVDALEPLRMLRPAKKHAVSTLLEPLFARLNSEERLDRLRAVCMLGKIGNPQAVEPLLAIFAQQDPIIQVNIIDVLDQLGFPLDTFQAEKQLAVEALITYLNDDNSFDRLRIVQLLGKLRDQRAVAPLLLAFTQQDSSIQTEDVDEDVPAPTLQAQIITALEQIDMPPASKQQALSSLVEPLIKRLNSDANCRESVQLLGKIGDQRAVPALLALLDHPLADMQIEPEIIAALEHIGTRLNMLETVKQRSIDILIEHLKNKDDAKLLHTLDVLNEIKDPRLVEPLIAIFEQQSSNVQNNIINVLKEMGLPPTTRQQVLGLLVDGLIANLDSADWSERRDAARMLGTIGDERAVAPLVAMFPQEDERVQTGIIEALECIDLSQVARFVPYLLNAQAWYLRVRGVWALARLYGREAIPQLTTLQNDPEIGDAATYALRHVEQVLSETIHSVEPSSSEDEAPQEELSLEERKQREYMRGRIVALDPEAVSADDELPAFMAPPPDAPAYYGFVVLDDIEVEGFRLGKISDFEAMPDMVSGDAFIVAPDNSRAGLVWELAHEVFAREICLMDEGCWGVWSVGFLYPMTTRDNMRRNLQSILPFLRKEWQIWQEYYQ